MTPWSRAWPRPPEAGIRGRHPRSGLFSEARAGIAATHVQTYLPVAGKRTRAFRRRLHSEGCISPAALAPSLRRRPARTAARPSMPGVRHRRHGRQPIWIFPDTSDRHHRRQAALLDMPSNAVKAIQSRNVGQIERRCQSGTMRIIHLPRGQEPSRNDIGHPLPLERPRSSCRAAGHISRHSRTIPAFPRVLPTWNEPESETGVPGIPG